MHYNGGTLFRGPLETVCPGDARGESLLSGELLRKHWCPSGPTWFSVRQCWKPAGVHTGSVYQTNKQGVTNTSPNVHHLKTKKNRGPA